MILLLVPAGILLLMAGALLLQAVLGPDRDLEHAPWDPTAGYRPDCGLPRCTVDHAARNRWVDRGEAR